MTNFLKKHISLLLLVFITNISNAQTPGNLRMVSSAFQDGKPIPAKYTCDSTNISPQLSWTGVPEKTSSFALIMDDPDAPMGTWVHWVVYDIPAAVARLEEKQMLTQIKAVDGLNSWNETGYNGPCPPGGTHRYQFKLYALDKTLAAKEGMTKEELLAAMKDHILAETTLTGLFRVQ